MPTSPRLARRHFGAARRMNSIECNLVQAARSSRVFIWALIYFIARLRRRSLESAGARALTPLAPQINGIGGGQFRFGDTERGSEFRARRPRLEMRRPTRRRRAHTPPALQRRPRAARRLRCVALGVRPFSNRRMLACSATISAAYKERALVRRRAPISGPRAPTRTRSDPKRAQHSHTQLTNPLPRPPRSPFVRSP